MYKKENATQLALNMRVAYNSLTPLANFSNIKSTRSDFSQAEWSEFIDHFQQLVIMEYYLVKLRMLLVEQYLL